MLSHKKNAVKHIFSLLILVLFSTIVSAQCFTKAKIFTLRKYDKTIQEPGIGKYHIRSKFGHGRISSVPAPEDFLEGEIIAIDYYYTKFKTDTNFSQVSLDSARFANLEMMYPSVFAMLDKVPVRFLEQTQAQNKKTALFYYHGFVVHYRTPYISKEERLQEIVDMEKMFKRGFQNDFAPQFGETRVISGTRPGDILSVWGYNLSLGTPDTIIRSHAKFVKQTVAINSRDEFVTCYQEGHQVASDTILVKMYRVPKKYYPGSTPPPFTNGMYGLVDVDYEGSKLDAMAFRRPRFYNEVTSDLYSTLSEFKSDSIVLVIDVTGSMTKSIAQVLRWATQENMKSKIKGVVFFNDGDQKSSSSKEIGATGGIYSIKKLKGLQKTLIEAMRNGNGGDVPENDLEAILHARGLFGTANYILVADNLSIPRDFGLINKVKFPVNILICNGVEAIEEYVDLAEGTRGRILNKKK